MAIINVKFIHPTEASEIEAELDTDVITAEMMINQLISQGFILDIGQNYRYTLRVSRYTEIINSDQTLASVGVNDDCLIQVLVDLKGNERITPRQRIRNKRLASDYEEMNLLRGKVISWKPIRGEKPHIEEYELTVNIRTIVGFDENKRPIYRETSVIRLYLNADYPTSAPDIRMVNTPFPFHPNWWTSGRWAHGAWKINESLGEFVHKMIKSLQYEPVMTNPATPANREAADWYIKNKDSGWFPCDKSLLPELPKQNIWMQNEDKIKDNGCV